MQTPKYDISCHARSRARHARRCICMNVTLPTCAHALQPRSLPARMTEQTSQNMQVRKLASLVHLGRQEVAQTHRYAIGKQIGDAHHDHQGPIEVRSSDRGDHGGEDGVNPLGWVWGMRAGRSQSDGQTQNLENKDVNKHGRTFGSGDRIGFELDTANGVMRFFRNDVHIKGADIFYVPMGDDSPLYAVATLRQEGSSVELRQPQRRFDKQGVMYLLGTQAGAQEYVNPHK